MLARKAPLQSRRKDAPLNDKERAVRFIFSLFRYVFRSSFVKIPTIPPDQTGAMIDIDDEEEAPVVRKDPRLGRSLGAVCLKAIRAVSENAFTRKYPRRPRIFITFRILRTARQTGDRRAYEHDACQQCDYLFHIFLLIATALFRAVMRKAILFSSSSPSKGGNKGEDNSP